MGMGGETWFGGNDGLSVSVVKSGSGGIAKCTLCKNLKIIVSRNDIGVGD